MTQEGSPNFVPPAERIAVFDNDGTLWGEQPITCSSSSRSTASRARAAESEWKTKEPFAACSTTDIRSASRARRAIGRS